ncbi:MAG TPA: class I SAM-dependent methyltransferase, partial [Bacteroidales bacterium]|nr:class I SAM-dependent methyltransferase [Bacteroidales bacterium]
MNRGLITEKPKEQVSEMFNNIARRYDSLNSFLSAGNDRRWRQRLADSLRPHKPKTILDVATGTADVAIVLAQLQP